MSALTRQLDVERACAALAACVSVDGAKEIRDKAVAVRDYWRRQRGAGAGAAASAARIVARADLRMGELLKLEPMARAAPPPQASGRPRGTKAVSSVPAQDRPVPTLRERGISKNESSRLQAIATKATADPAFAERFVEQQAAKAAAFVGRAPGITDDPSHDADTADAWETPDRILDLVREVFGCAIDTDPASNEHAQRRVQAATFYARRDDGLVREWRGCVFCNPPYSDSGAFLAKLLASPSSRPAILLVNSSTGSSWFQTALRSCDAVCFPRGRVAFVSPLGHPSAPRHSQTIFYFGVGATRFARVFGAPDVGVVLRGALA